MELQSTSYKTLFAYSIDITGVTMSQDGQTLICGGKDGAVYIWSLSKEDVTHIIPGVPFHIVNAPRDRFSADLLAPFIPNYGCFVVDPQGKFVVTVRNYIAEPGQQYEIHLWNLPEGSHIGSIRIPYPIKQLFIHPKSNLLASVYSGVSTGSFAQLWHLPSGQFVSQIGMPKQFSHHHSPSPSVQLSQNWETLFLRIEYEFNDFPRVITCVYEFSPTERKFLRLPEIYDQAPNYISSSMQVLNKDGHNLAIAYPQAYTSTRQGRPDDFPILLYTKSLTSSKARFDYVGWLKGISQSFLWLAFTPNGQFFIGIQMGRIVRIWNLADTKNNHPLHTLTGHQAEITCAVLHNDGQFLATGDLSGEVRVWEIPEGKLIKVFAAHKDHITCLATSPNGRFLVSSSRDETIKLWEWNSK